MSLFGAMSVAGTGMSAEAERLSATASNIANANSAIAPGGQPYRAREVVFEAVAPDGSEADSGAAAGAVAGVKVAAVVESAAPTRRVYDPGNGFADDQGYVEMPNVNPVDEMVNMISAQQDYQASLEAFNVAKSLALRTLTI
jgi:flagellar basal-body rod protein FlgC